MQSVHKGKALWPALFPPQVCFCFPPGAVFGAMVGRERDGCGLARMTGSTGGLRAHLGGQDS